MPNLIKTSHSIYGKNLESLGTLSFMLMLFKIKALCTAIYNVCKHFILFNKILSLFLLNNKQDLKKNIMR